MSSCFSFRFEEPDNDGRESLLVFFSSAVSATAVDKLLKDDVVENLAPATVYLMALERDFSKLDDLQVDTVFRAAFESYVGDIAQKLMLLKVSASGVVTAAKAGKTVNELIVKKILSAGMLSIFKKRKGLIVSSPSYHFLKPSGDHCDKFIRASNLFISGVEVEFLAISILPYLKEGMNRLYVDTSTISYLISTAIAMSNKFTKSHPVIESFESYTAFDGGKREFDFVESPESFIFISATTSGSLVEEILKNANFDNSQILTIFYSSPLPTGQVGLYDISGAIPNGIKSKSPMHCELCRQGSKVIRIIGDQFLPETPKHELLVIKKSDFKENRKSFFKDFAARNVLGWNVVSESKQDFPEHFYIDVRGVIGIQSDRFSEKLRKNVKKFVSCDTERVIHLSDPCSSGLAGNIKEIIDGDAGRIKWSALEEVSDDEFKRGRSVVVVAGAITSGRKLLEASRKLRVIPADSSITYIVGISKIPTHAAQEQLRKDLEQGGHSLVVLQHFPLPRISEHTATSWSLEKEVLAKYSDLLDGSAMKGEKMPEYFLGRLDALKQPNKDSNSLFLMGPDGDKLRLRPTFAFWSDIEVKAEDASQADVYWTIQSVLHDLRLKSSEIGLASTYHTTLISPACFDRFNDGVVQASLLRSATLVELNYAISEEFSEQMGDVIQSIVKNWKSPQGEGALEFLMALWTKRLRLMDEHLRGIIGLSDAAMPEEMRFLIARLADG